MSFQAPSLLRLAAAAKAAWPRAKVIAGGPHPTVDPASVLAPGLVDAAVLGEGEVTFAEVVERVEQGRDLAGVPGTRGLARGNPGARAGPAVPRRPGSAPLPGLGPD